jgi:acetyl-CoA carboxylase biotin carboxyl carrier protein
MDTRRIKKLIELVKETGIGELEVKSGDESVRISCQSPLAPIQPAPAVSAAPAPAPVAEADGAGKVTEIMSGYQQKSPMVGSVYLSSAPGAKPFVAVGDRVAEGDTLCLIEAMKMFNKIEAEKSGVVSARMVENEQPVEYDQVLFIIEEE